VDIITGEVLDRNGKNFGFERFTEKGQNMKSGDSTKFPVDYHVQDPITGRKIVQR